MLCTQRGNPCHHSVFRKLLSTLSAYLRSEFASVMSATHTLGETSSATCEGLARPNFNKRRHLVKTLSRLVLYFSYAFLGAGIFMLVEKKEETNSDAADRLMRQLRRMAAKYNFSEGDLDEFVTNAHEMSLLRKKRDWTLLNSTAFALAAITTIGRTETSLSRSMPTRLVRLVCWICHAMVTGERNRTFVPMDT